MVSDKSFDLVLASASPRRRALLEGLGLRPRLVPTGISEEVLPAEDPRAHVARLADAKSRAALARLGGAATPGTVLLAADTAVVLGDDLLGKPVDDADALAMLLRLSGRVHEVVTGVRLRTGLGPTAAAVSVTRVRFRDFDFEVAGRYVATGEPRDKAGAYGIQGVGALLVDSIEGSWSNVVGLPLERLPELFGEVGFDLWREVGPRWPQAC